LDIGGRSLVATHIKGYGAMTHSTTTADHFRVLDNDEIDAVSGGACITETSAYNIRGKGELEIGFTECDGLPGVKIPYAKWTPSKPIK
jgi:hypothetical protein